jgi:hypothetical protein
MLGRLDVQLLGPAVGEAVIPRIVEGSALRITLRPLSADLAATIPTSMRWRLDDLSQGTAIVDWTSLTPATSVNVVISSSQNAIRNGMCVERRQFVAEAADADGPIRKTIEFDIENIQGIQ